jgi:hypothetical protein
MKKTPIATKIATVGGQNSPKDSKATKDQQKMAAEKPGTKPTRIPRRKLTFTSIMSMTDDRRSFMSN